MPFPDPPAQLHLIGIKGVGMAGVALLLQAQGYMITGSDTNERFMTDAMLAKSGIRIAEGFDGAHLQGAIDGVIYSTAYGETNVERAAARALALPEWSYPEVAGYLMSAHEESVAVAGSHGKTTVSALLASLLEAVGEDPTALVGAPVLAWGNSARSGSGRWFVAEADEYQEKFLQFRPRNLVVTNIDYDHPDYFRDAAHYEEAFQKFMAQVPTDGRIVVCGDDARAVQLAQQCAVEVITYGTTRGCDWQVSEISVRGLATEFTLTRSGKTYGIFVINFPGEHYALNAAAAVATVAESMALTPEIVANVLRYYRGIARRLELRGQSVGAPVFDDYAHHPTEVAAVLTALRRSYPNRRLVLAFQPHTYSRTSAFLDSFARALGLADLVIVPPIYGSAREVAGEVSNRLLVEKINAAFPGKARAVGSLSAVGKVVYDEQQTDDVIVTMGAGDIWKVAETLVSERGR